MVEGAVVAIAVLAAASVLGIVLGRRGGRVRTEGGRRLAPADGLSPADLGHTLGERATLLQFSSSFCAPCRAARHLLAGVAAGNAGVMHVEVDVDDHMDLVRLLDVRRTPTTFVLGPQGHVSARVSGVPRLDDIAVAVAHAAGEPAGGDSDAGHA